MNFDLLEPDECRRLEPSLARALVPDAWVYRYRDGAWTLSIATHGAPGSGTLSLGGFRIAPESRTSAEEYDNDREAIELAMGMEEKVYWSRTLNVGGPRLLAHPAPLVGGKCVLRPTGDSRIGQPRDEAMLDFAGAALNDMVDRSGVFPVTGQDLGHGIMSDGETPSLEYLHRHYRGSVTADTSKPTAEGNWRILRGMLRGLDIPMDRARVALIGYGNIGEHVLERLSTEGATCTVVEPSEARRAAAQARGAKAVGVERKMDIVREPHDAIVVNAAGGSLDDVTVRAIAANGATRVVCGSENLAMPDPAQSETLRAAGVIYCPTELGGMMGYLTAVEEFLAQRAGESFDLGAMFVAAERLEDVGEAVTARVRAGNRRERFEDAALAIYAGSGRVA